MKFVKNISRSVFKFSYPVQGSFNLGEICPIGAPLEVVPGDEFKANIAMVIRMATPIAPIMGDIDAEITAHFVPLRLIGNANYGDISFNGNSYKNNNSYKFFEKLISNGLGNPTDWQQTNHELLTAEKAKWTPSVARSQNYTTIGEALGLGLGRNTTGLSLDVLAYPLYGYNLIYAERFRNQDVEAYKTDLARVSNRYGFAGSPNDQADDDDYKGTYNQCLSVAYKHGDYFTNAKPSPQKGGPVELPLGNLAPVKIATEDPTAAHSGVSYALTVEGDAKDQNGVFNLYNPSYGNDIALANAADFENSEVATLASVYTDLSAATAATINQFIEAYNIQALLMNDVKGTRYFDIIVNHFGIQNEDIKLYIPQLLSYKNIQINISPVVQQSGSAENAGSDTQQGNFLGTTGGYSFTPTKGALVSNAFGEFGYIYFLIVARHKRTYGQGIPKLFLRSKRFDFFFPELGRIGYQPILTKELIADAVSPHGEEVFGYIPAWEEIRRVGFGQTFGFLNPNKDNSLDYWTLTEQLPKTSYPTLSISFLKEDRANLARALTISDQGPDFIFDAVIYGTKSTLVPIGSDPKLWLK